MTRTRIVYSSPQRAAEVETGRRLLAGHLFALIAVSALTILHYNLAVGHDRLVPQIIRFGFTLMLCRAIYRGSFPAKWFTMILVSIGAVWFAVIIYSNWAKMDVWGLISVGTSLFTYIAFLVAMTFSKKITVFMESGAR